MIQNLLVIEEYVTTRNIVFRESEESGEDDLYSSHSNFRSPIGKQQQSHNHHQIADLIKGRLHLALKAELAEDYMPRLESLKRQYINEA